MRGLTLLYFAGCMRMKAWGKIRSWLIKARDFVLNPRLLLCLGLAWIITNGWSYIMLGLGLLFGVGWMTAVAGAYLAFLWLPMTPEKVVTVIIAMALLRWLFPRDTKTLGVLRDALESIKSKLKRK